MKKTLIDAGPLIALFDKDDNFHIKALDFINKYHGQLITTWPVITEVLHLLDFCVKVQIDFLEWIEKGGIEIFDLTSKSLGRIKNLSLKYSDIPMDLADATLIVASEHTGISEIITIDSDFYIYRNIRNEYLKNIFL